MTEDTFKRKVAHRIEQASGRMVLAVLECGHAVYGLKPDDTEHWCVLCAKEANSKVYRNAH